MRRFILAMGAGGRKAKDLTIYGFATFIAR